MKIGPVQPTNPANLIQLYRQTRQIRQSAAPDGLERHGREDRIDISQDAQWMSKLQQMPETRQDKVERIRRELDAGTYDVDRKLGPAVERMIDELPLNQLAERVQGPRFV